MTGSGRDQTSTNFASWQDEMCAFGNDCFIFSMHLRFGDHTRKSPRPRSFTRIGANNGPPLTPPRSNPGKGEAQTPDVYPITTVKSASNLMIGEISHRGHAKVPTPETDLIWLDKDSLGAEKSAKQRDLPGVGSRGPSTVSANDDLFAKVLNLVGMDLNVAISIRRSDPQSIRRSLRSNSTLPICDDKRRAFLVSARNWR